MTEKSRYFLSFDKRFFLPRFSLQKTESCQCALHTKDKQWTEYLDFGPHGLSVIRNGSAHKLRVKILIYLLVQTRLFSEVWMVVLYVDGTLLMYNTHVH